MSLPLAKRISLALAGLVAATAIILYWSRAQKAESAEAKAPARDVPYLDGKWIRYSANYASRSQIEFAVAQKSSLEPVVSVTGTVTFDPERMAAVGARIAGRVRSISRLEGDEVKAGDILAEIESAELGQSQAALISARAHAEAATANEKREKELRPIAKPSSPERTPCRRAPTSWPPSSAYAPSAARPTARPAFFA